jgi:deoxyhypusine monooxygenase
MLENAKVCVDDIDDLNQLREILLNDKESIRLRTGALFKLRTIGCLGAVKILEEALIKEKSSDLLRHEVCYCFGQMIDTEENKVEIQNFLYKEVFENPRKYASIVLHEAAEALGNINSENNVKLLERFLNFEDDIIQETCLMSVENINWMNNTKNGQTEGLDKLKLHHHTNDPAPPFNFKLEAYSSVEKIKKILHNESESLFNRYRALFTLREFDSEEAVQALCECFGKNLKTRFSPLFKHEVSFILGQMCEKAKSALEFLELVLKDEEEDPIVRHETALTLGEITKSKSLLEEYTKHKNQLISESCEIALDFVDYWNGCC